MANQNFRKLTGAIAQQLGIRIDPEMVRTIATDLGFNPEDITDNQAKQVSLRVQQAIAADSQDPAAATGNPTEAPPNFLQQRAAQAAHQTNIWAAQTAAALRQQYSGMLAHHLLASEDVTEDFLRKVTSQDVNAGFDLGTISLDPNDLGGMLNYQAPPQLTAQNPNSAARQLSGSAQNTSANGKS